MVLFPYACLYLDVDALGKPGSGLAAGNLIWLGSYAVCQNISDSQYCLASKVYFQITGMSKVIIIIIINNCVQSVIIIIDH